MPLAALRSTADLKDVVALNLRRLRQAKGWTQEELAGRVGLSVRYVGQVERGQASMSVTVLGYPFRSRSGLGRGSGRALGRVRIRRCPVRRA